MAAGWAGAVGSEGERHERLVVGVVFVDGEGCCGVASVTKYAGTREGRVAVVVARSSGRWCGWSGVWGGWGRSRVVRMFVGANVAEGIGDIGVQHCSGFSVGWVLEVFAA